MPWKRQGRREIVHIVVTGYEKKKIPSKHYVFVIDVTWNNNDRFEVYRRYSDFFSFQTTLKALFPAAAGRKNEERVIPQLPKRIFVGRSHVAKVAEARLEQINRYTQTLISLDPNISESAHVVGFFSPRSNDKELPKLHLHRPTSLHPSKIPIGDVFEEYCALAEYVAEDDSQVGFKPGDKVLVMSKDKSGWWMCNVNGDVGWGPPSYLKKCIDILEDEDSDQSEDEKADQKAKDSDDSGVGENMMSGRSLPSSSINSTSTTGSSISSLSLPPQSLTVFQTPEIVAEEYKAIDSYQSDGPGQISFEVGQTIHVLDKLEDGWWFVSNGKDEGWAPCSYLEGDKDEEGITNLDSAEKYYSVDNYEAEEEDEISFKRGMVVEVLQKSLDGWWMIKVDKHVGLAPATFLKKMENPEQLTVKEVIPKIHPSSPLAAIKAFQQPPRRESVRARASMRISPAINKKPQQQNLSVTKKNSTPMPSSLTDNPYRNLVFHSEQNPNRLPTIVSKSVSPETTSDSDPDDNYLNVPFPIPKRTSSQGSKSSFSSSEGGKSKRPVALPRKKLSTSASFTEASLKKPDIRPPLPPKPSDSPSTPPSAHPAKMKLKKYNSVDSSLNPQRPVQRPSNSEIRRAQDRARLKLTKTTPELSIVDEDGADTASIYSSKSSKSLASISSSKSAPGGMTGKQQKGVEKVKEKRAQSTQDDSITKKVSKSKLQVPERPPRPRRRSEGETVNVDTSLVASAKDSATPSEKMDENGDGLNQDVASTLLRYIITSEDQTLKKALRELLKQDTDAASILSSEK